MQDLSNFEREYAVWYSGGSGGFITAWLLQVCIDHTTLCTALQNFPANIKTKHTAWQDHEQVPDDVGIISNGFYPNGRIHNTNIIKEQVTSMIESIVHNDKDMFNKTLSARLRYFFTTHLWKRCWHYNDDRDHYLNSEQFALLNDSEFLKKVTDPVFNNDSMVYVVAPQQYQRIANQTKLSTYSEFNINDIILKNKEKIKIFYTKSLWKGDYISNLETIINRPLTDAQKTACIALRNHWLSIQPSEIKRFINEC